jgi:ATP-dependent 26S proteasome regulatory subunit
MTDFEAALAEQLSRNAELAQRRVDAEAEMDRAKQAREEENRQEVARQQEERNTRHAELAEHLGKVAAQLKAASPNSYIVRTGWTASGEEFLVKISTRQTAPARSLHVEVDRDDDAVLARWKSDVGTLVEMWRLLEVTPAMLTQLVLQVADEPFWRSAKSPPPFPASG